MHAYKQTCKKQITSLLITLLFTLGCSFPLQVTLATPTAVSASTPTFAPTQTPLATPVPGSDQNPLILALPPSTAPNETVIAAGNVLAAFIEARTGYKVVTIVPASEDSLIETMAKGNANIAVLSPLGYALAFENNAASAMLAQVRNGEMFYGAQLIVNRESEFAVYYDEESGQNTADAASALQQFADKKPCWSDEVSPSGHVIPLGLLNQAQVQVRAGAFLEGQPNVVRGVYADDICDFGATFIDARTSPVLEADYPDVMDKVRVVWRIPEIIPYETIVISPNLSFDVRRNIQRVFIDFMSTPEGKNTLQTIYGFDEMLPVEDSAYTEFITLVKASNLTLLDLIE